MRFKESSDGSKYLDAISLTLEVSASRIEFTMGVLLY